MMSNRFPYRRSVEPTGPAKVRADESAECPPHYWVVTDRTQTCRKCGLAQTIGRDGRVVQPEAAVEAPAAEPGAATADATAGESTAAFDRTQTADEKES